MARTTNITRELVIDTLNGMKANGKHITAASLRTELGGGKYETYSTFFNEWKKSQEETGKEIAAIEIEIPQEAIKAVNDAATVIWRAATNHHAESIKAIQAESQLKIDLEIKEKEEAKELVKSLENELEKKENEFEEINSCKDKLIKTINSLELQIQKMQLCLDNEIEKNSELKTKNNELKKQLETEKENEFKLKMLNESNSILKHENKELLLIKENYLKLTGKYELIINDNKILTEKIKVKEEQVKTLEDIKKISTERKKPEASKIESK
jgi:hypothetical protein